MTIELRPLRHLVTLVELGSFARAAATLQLSQPALTRSIQALERRVGTELVLRSPAGVIPTDVGQLLSQRARELLQLAEDLDRDVISKSTLQSGHVAVGAGPYPAETIFVVALQNFVAAYPMVKVRLQVRAWDELLSRLRSREIDFFVAEVSTLQRESDLDIQALDEHPLYFVARPGHPLAGRAEITAKETLAFPFVTMSRISPRVLQPMMMAAQRTATRRSTHAPPFPAIESATLSALRRMVIASDMIAAVTLPCIREDLEGGPDRAPRVRTVVEAGLRDCFAQGATDQRRFNPAARHDSPGRKAPRRRRAPPDRRRRVLCGSSVCRESAARSPLSRISSGPTRRTAAAFAARPVENGSPAVPAARSRHPASSC